MPSITDENRLSIVRPDIAAEWHPTLNENLSPSDVAIGSRKKVWWVCPTGNPDHDYDAWVRDRTGGRTGKGSGCPYCDGKRVCKDNCLATVKPDIAAEWDYEENFPLTPHDVHYGSKNRAWWVCSKNPSHKWPAVIQSRTSTRNSRGCPHCNKSRKTSFPEQCLFYYLRRVFPDTVNQYNFIGKSELDIFIPSLNVAIEYDGYFYHKSVESVRRDEKKNKDTKEHGISLIRIRNNSSPDKILPTLNTYESKVFYHNQWFPLSLCINQVLTFLADAVSDLHSKKRLLEILPVDVDSDRVTILDIIDRSEIENSLALKYPMIAMEWHPTKNGGLLPEHFSEKSKERAWWLCSTCGYEWRAHIGDRTHKNSGCKQCWEARRGEALKRQVLITFPDGNQIVTSGTKEASTITGIPMPTIWSAARDCRRVRKGIKFEYVG